MAPWTCHLGHATWDMRLGTWDLGLGTWEMRLGTWVPEIVNWTWVQLDLKFQIIKTRQVRTLPVPDQRQNRTQVKPTPKGISR